MHGNIAIFFWRHQLGGPRFIATTWGGQTYLFRPEDCLLKPTRSILLKEWKKSYLLSSLHSPPFRSDRCANRGCLCDRATGRRARKTYPKDFQRTILNIYKQLVSCGLGSQEDLYIHKTNFYHVHRWQKNKTTCGKRCHGGSRNSCQGSDRTCTYTRQIFTTYTGNKNK